MSHPLYWSSKTHFYPIGNTPPVCLTQDLSPEQSADILLLGCGDPRHILFTLYADLTAPPHPRPLAFTCCDLDPAILARNVILFTLLEDNESVDRIWDIFYHFQIDDSTLSLLVRHCRKLIAASSSLETWRESPYGSFLRFLDTRTLQELRRLWRLYAEFPKLPKAALNKFREQKENVCKLVLKSKSVLSTASILASRSAGPLLQKALIPVSEELLNYWKTGTMLQRPEDIKKARRLNPTFIYSLSGEMFNIHYGTFPHGSHLAPIFAPLVPDQFRSARMQQFNSWVQAFRDSRKAKAITIWLYAGDALAFCHALCEYSRSSQTSTNIPIASWRAAQINFDQVTTNYSPPTTFDVVDTSNLTDHLGLLNILVAAQPLLKTRPASQSVLYTESLILSGDSATQSLQHRLKTNMSTAGLLLGLVPRPYLTGFTTQSHTHELMILAESHGNYRERIAWVHPASGDPYFRDQGQRLTLEAQDLAMLLADIFKDMCPSQRPPSLRSLFFRPSPLKIREENLPQYHHKSFAMLFELLQNRITVPNDDWTLVAHLFLGLAHKRGWFSRRIGVQELALHLFHLATRSNQPFKPNTRQDQSIRKFYVKALQALLCDQSALCVVLSVPRNNLRVMLENPRLVGSVLLQCKMIYNGYYSDYTSIQAAWGRCVPSSDSTSMVIQEDPAGRNGNSGLVVTFWVAANILNHQDTTAVLGIVPTPLAYASLGAILGPSFQVFSAKVHTSRHVQILPYRPALPGEPRQTWFPQFQPSTTTPAARDISIHGVVTSGWATPSQITSLVAKTDTKLRSIGLGNSKIGKNMTHIHQVAPCTLQSSTRGRTGLISYPYPVRGDSCKLGQKAGRWEVSVPVAESPEFGGYSSPLLRRDKHTELWNIHHINLERMPRISISNPQKLDWLPAHVNMQLSARERSWETPTAGGLSMFDPWSRIRKLLDANGSRPVSMPRPTISSPLTELKQSISNMILRYSGLSGRSKKLFWLKEASSNPYAWILLRDLRLDLTSSTVVLDSAAIWVPDDIRTQMFFDPLNQANDNDVLITTSAETQAWKRLLPAFAERCRTWTHRPDCDYVLRNAATNAGSLDLDPFCGCGKRAGLGPPDWNHPEWKGLLAHATRVAISPLFPVPYLEKILDDEPANSKTNAQNKGLFSIFSSQKRGYSSHTRATMGTLPRYRRFRLNALISATIQNMNV